MSSPRLYDDPPRLPEGTDIDLGAVLLQPGSPPELEIGPGRGGFLLERLQADPAVRIVGFEIRRKWATLMDARLAKERLSARARVFAEDARASLARLESESLSRVFIHFPDPWWKKRHHKRLVVTSDLVAEVARALVIGGELFVQTDVIERAEAYERVVNDEPRFVPWTGEQSARVADNPYGAMSPRERRAVQDGLPIVRLRYRRVAGAVP